MGQLGGAPTVGEIAVVADAMEAVGQDVEQEAADELVGTKVITFCLSWWR